MNSFASKKYDLAIVGGGIMGTFHAYHALLQGYSVILFEKNKQARGATVRNFGQIVPSGMNLKWQRFGRKSLAIYKDLQSKTDLSVRQNGTVYLASNEEEITLLEELQKINQENNYPSQLLTVAACLEKYPGLKKEYCHGGLFFPEEISVDPRVMIHKVQAFLKEKFQLELREQCLIQAIETNTQSCKLIDSQNQKYLAEKVLICNGTDFSNLYPVVFGQSDISVVKLQMLQTIPLSKQRIAGNILTGLSIRRYESFSECPSYQKIKAKEDKESLAKTYGVHILFKQSDDGSVIIGDSHEYATVERRDDLGFDIRGDINNFILKEARAIFDLESWTIAKSWVGFYSQCRESDIFTQAINEQIYITTGIGGKGMTASPGFAAQNLKNLLP